MQIAQEPSSGGARDGVTHSCCVDGQVTSGVDSIGGHVERHEASGCDMLRDRMFRHPAPTEPCQQEVQSAAKIDKAPERSARDAEVWPVPIDRIGQHELDMAFQVLRCNWPTQEG